MQMLATAVFWNVPRRVDTLRTQSPCRNSQVFEGVDFAPRSAHESRTVEAVQAQRMSRLHDIARRIEGSGSAPRGPTAPVYVPRQQSQSCDATPRVASFRYRPARDMPSILAATATLPPHSRSALRNVLRSNSASMAAYARVAPRFWRSPSLGLCRQ